MARRFRRHSLEFKKQAVARMAACDSVVSLSKELDIERRLLYRWRDELSGKPKQSEGDGGDPAVIGQLRQQVASLKAALTEEVLKSRLFTGALQRVEAQRRPSKDAGGKASTTKSEQ